MKNLNKLTNKYIESDFYLAPYYYDFQKLQLRSRFIPCLNSLEMDKFEIVRSEATSLGEQPVFEDLDKGVYPRYGFKVRTVFVHFKRFIVILGATSFQYII